MRLVLKKIDFIGNLKLLIGAIIMMIMWERWNRTPYEEENDIKWTKKNY